ncbi:hypothetical protein HPB52_003534 [Rhipicephalus sanguineus]|uniref:Uncharacterized protein n=1 Tax=Rhipicephalus sanguineus TaxID=34632 RepID=A0A9D4QD41_RHISA|nr:hypothetical protein HPB52_003534 [Rhipicephalus sanguineus]
MGAEILSEAVTIENILQRRSTLYERQMNSTSATEVFMAIGDNTECLRQLIHSIGREELQKAAAPPPPMLFVYEPSIVSLQSAQPLQHYEGTRASPPFVYAGPVAHRSEQPYGEVDHLYHQWPYGRLGLRGFSAYSPPPCYGQRPPGFGDYLAQQHMLQAAG